ncbi:DUF1361 domain-containing protein [Flavobacteriaceae bacterium SZ-1-7]|uniref:DUF1361 domain-containing protein n=1 Tax=Tamlana sedimenti TaxID=3134126 RepID=UPI00312597AC
MNNIKQLIINRYKIISILITTTGFSIVLLVIRMKLTHSFFYLFLVWNLFLAVIPFTITSYLSSLPKLNKVKLAIWFCVWLLFLPNAPYIITDLLHIKISRTSFLWLDILVVTSFALNGMLLFYLSVLEMKKILQPIIKKSALNLWQATLLFLMGFGVYLGRFLRYNSWEILSNPKYLFNDIISIALKPLANKEAWLFTLLFGTFLWVGFWVFKMLSTKGN